MTLLAESSALQAFRSPGVAAELRLLPELPPSIDLAGLPLVPLSRDELIETLVARARQRADTTVHYLNAHTFNLARSDESYRALLRGCDLLYADGNSMVLAGRLLGYDVPTRLTAADYFEAFCRRCAAESISLYLMGGAAGVAAVAAERLTRGIPGLRIVGISHGYLDAEESAEVVARVSASGTDVLVVGMGSPRQERWIHQYGGQTGVPVQWSVGALLDYVAGVEPRAPRWMCRCGGEWLYRYLHDPSRRWKRYLLGNARFMAWLVRAWVMGHCR